ncbi:c-type cytochrome [Amylibacter sp. IMCC11727]|uniref:c-type cytochrome n=1 Tax=Amylibacter sp. IMCC11727 TaxID=3039851 RepID=UPI00244E2C7D|nr:c-type cytochrome [Amylibacter sp. IMCC11727]WGI20518.1 c-type cytochrome [Amylibacter sp. IMCC11727]
MSSVLRNFSGVTVAIALSASTAWADTTTQNAEQPVVEAETEQPASENAETITETTETTEEVVVAEITGDVKKGKKVFKKCKACHKVKEGKNGAGPTLYKIIGREAAQIEGFKYSKPMQESGLTWDVETLTAYLKAPKKLVPGTSMLFNGLKKDKDIENLIAYLDDASKG